MTPVQNFVTNQIEKYLSEKLGTTISIDYVDIRFPNKLTLNGVFVEGQHQDTILYAKHINGKVSNLLSLNKDITIDYIGIENGFIRMEKNAEQIWNYQFIVDAFKTNSKSDKKGKLILEIEDVDIRDLRFQILDKWHGSDLFISLHQFKVRDNAINSTKKSINIDKVYIDGLDMEVVKYESTYPAGTFERKIDNNPFNPESWGIKVDIIQLENSTFKTNNTLMPKILNQFDGGHIDIKNINIDVENLYVVNDSIFGKVNHVSAIEKSGIMIRDMQGDVKVSPRISEIKNLHLKTNKSEFNHYFAMEYPRFPAFLDYIHQVTMIADVKNSTIAIEDIGYFAQNMNRWKKEIYKGDFKGRGTVDKLDIHYFDLQDEVTHMKGTFSIHGIPDMQNTIMNLVDGEIHTTYTELLDLFPQIENLELKELEKTGNISFLGNMNGLYNNMDIDGFLKTNAGDINIESLNIDFSDPNYFKYKGIVHTDNIQLNNIIENDEFGIMGFSGEITGDGFNYEKNKISLKGTVWPFHFRDYSYDKINVEAQIENGVIQSQLKSFDKKANLDINISMNFNEEQPVHVFKTNIEWLDLYALHLVNDTIQFKGYSEGTFTGKSFKKMEGQGVFKNFIAIRDIDTFDFSELAVHSIQNSNSNYLNLKSEELNVLLSGKFYLDELGPTFQNIFSYYLPDIINTNIYHIPDQNFLFQIESKNLDKYTKLFYPDIQLPKGINIQGVIKDNTNEIQLDVKVPTFRYKSLTATDIHINSYGDLLGMKINAHANNVSSVDKKMISELDIISTLSKNKLEFNIATTVSNENDRATINGYAYTNEDSFIFKIHPSEIFFNNQIWTIAGDNQIVYAKDYLHVDNFILKSQDQAITINAKELKPKKGRNHIDLKNINLQPILQMIGMVNLPVYGNVNGYVEFANIAKGLDAEFDIKTDELKSVESVLGHIIFKGKYTSNNSQLTLESPTGMHDSSGSILLSGTWTNIGLPNHSLDVHAVGKDAKITWAEPFMAELTKGLSGTVSGFLNFKGPFNTPTITGQANINDGKFIPLITGVNYTLPKTTIDITSKLFTISNSSIQDDEGNVGSLSGTIRHEYFSNIDFRVRMNSSKIKVLDLKENEGENFYGKVYSTANLSLMGLLLDMTMNITMTTLPGSKLYIPLADDIDLNEYEFIHFKKKFKQEDTDYQSERKTRLNIYMDALATTDLEAIIIMDPITNEIINAKGNGNLSMFIPSDGDLRLNGTYTIQTGYYDFILSQLQLLVYKNRFNILDGSSITWDGDLAEATVNVKANTIKRARLYDLITDDIERMGGTLLQSERNDAMLPQNVIIDMNMTGRLLSPEFKFNLNLEETRSVGTYAYQKLQRINSDDRELMNQVVSLLVVNQFMPTNGINSNLAVNTGVSNVTEMFSTFASSQLTNFTNKILGVEDLYVNLKYKNYNITDDISSGGLNYLNRNEAGLSVRKNFFSDRIVLDVGGVYDWGRAGYGSSGFSDNFALDFRLNYLLTKDGRLRLNVFRNSNFDAVSFQNVGKQGVGINFRRSFNNIYEFLGIKYHKPIQNINLKFEPSDTIKPPESIFDTSINPPLTQN